MHEFQVDLFVQLREQDVFDRIWTHIPSDRPAVVGMRIVSLGRGRERAVADLALRLADELRPDREPDMGHPLPERWQVEAGLLPVEPPYNGGYGFGSLPKSILGLAEVSRNGIFKVLRRGPVAYNTAVETDLAMLETRPLQLAALFERAAGKRTDEAQPSIDPIGAVDLDEALGGAVFGDRIALAAEAGDDAAARVGELLELAAARQADGLSAAVLSQWLRSDSDAVAPKGPIPVADALRDTNRPWSTLRATISSGGEARATGSASWVRDALLDHLQAANGATQAKSPEGRDTDSSDVSQPMPRPGWAIPIRLGWILGSPIWRHRSVATSFIMITSLFVVLGIAQAWADRTKTYLFQSDGSTSAALLGLAPGIVTLLSGLMIGYLIISVVVAVSVRRWASSFRFEDVPLRLGELESEARALAITEVARCPVRRDYARVAGAAAATLETATAQASEIARDFGRALQEEAFDAAERPGNVSPHREHLGTDRSLAGTDAGGIYRIYPLFVNALRNMFAASLVSAIHERWPRVRGVFWKETAASISDLSSASLKERLTRVLESGIRRGDLLRDGLDPADELAEHLWTDASVREAALRALHFEPDQPMPMLATPADNRQLDGTATCALIIAVPATLEPLVRDRAISSGAQVVVTDQLETAAALRVFPFQPGLYDFVDFETSESVLA